MTLAAEPGSRPFTSNTEATMREQSSGKQGTKRLKSLEDEPYQKLATPRSYKPYK